MTNNNESGEFEEQDEVLMVDNYNGVTKGNFIFHYVIGKGGFGRVWKVELKKNRLCFAMKEMQKAKFYYIFIHILLI